MGMLRALGLAFLATCGLAATAASVRADGTPYRYPTYDATPGFYDFRWTGFYAGAHLGGGFASFEANETILDPLLGQLILTYDQSVTSVVGGVQVGWQKQWEKLVAGVELKTVGAADNCGGQFLESGPRQSRDLQGRGGCVSSDFTIL